MDAIHVDGVRLELQTGDIAAQVGIDAIVNAANAHLELGGGVAGAIHRAAGPGLAEGCRPLAPIAPGSCVLSGAHQLPNRAVIHCLGPVYGRDEPAAELLAACYREALRLADEHGLRSVGLPAISTGAFAFPVRPAAEIAVRSVLELAAQLTAVRLVRFVLHTDEDLAVFREVLAGLRP